ncbi:MAG: IgGFc-binding protein [Fibrobacterales bacterium]
MKQSLLIIVLLLLSTVMNAQESGYTQYWTAIPEFKNGHGDDTQAALRFASLGDAITVIITMPADNNRLLGEVDIAAGEAGELSLATILSNGGDFDTNILESGLPDQHGIIQNRGVLITAEPQSNGGDARFSAYIDRFTDVNRDITSLKGESAEGYEFTIPGRDRWRNNRFVETYNAFDIVATEDNTEITITPKNAIIGYPAAESFTITLHRGQSFNASAVSSKASGHVGGSIVVSGKPIVVMFKDDSVTDDGMSGSDALGDQLVPDALAGNQFIVIRGGLTYSDGTTSGETAFITSVNSGTTTIEYNGSEYSLSGRGDIIGIPLTQDANYLSVKETGNVVHVLHGSGSPREIGGNLIPPIVCTGSRDVTLVRTQNNDKNGDRFDMYLITKKQNQNGFKYSLNGTSFQSFLNADFTDVSIPGGDDWVYFSNKSKFRTELDSGNTLRIRNETSGDDGDGLFHLGILEGHNAGNKGGYFSNFASLTGDAGIKNLGQHNYTLACDRAIPLIASGGRSYSWSSPSGHMHMVDSVSPDSQLFTPQSSEGAGPFLFEVTIVGSECDETKTIALSVFVESIDEDFGGDIQTCAGFEVSLNDVSDSDDAYTSIDERYLWTSDELRNDIQVMSPKVTVHEDALFHVAYDDGHCKMEKEIEITMENCGECDVEASEDQSICRGETVTLSAEGRGTFYDWQYEENGTTTTKTEASLEVSPEVTTTYTVRYNNAIKQEASFDWDPDQYCPAQTTVTVLDCLPDPDPVPDPEIIKTEIYDTNEDGTAETIIISFDSPITELLYDITSIDWPREGANNITADKKSVGIIDSLTIRIVLEDAFTTATQPDPVEPPFLTYGKSSVAIEDKIGPMVVESSKHPAQALQYAVKDENGEYTYCRQPDTLMVYLSEEVILPKENWESMFTMYPESGSPYTLSLLEKPEEGDDLYSFKIILDTAVTATIIRIGDRISFSSETEVTDTEGNSAMPVSVEIEGSENSRGHTSSEFRTSVIGVQNSTDPTVSTDLVPVYDLDGDRLDEILYGTAVLGDHWVPPYNYHNNSFGAFVEDEECTDTQELIPFDRDCLASLVIGTFKDQGAYTVSVFVYDHLGQFMHNWTQRFGYCEDFENEERKSQSDLENFFIHDLVWNMQDSHGRLAGAGVYFWRVIIQFESGETIDFTDKMGIVRQEFQCLE